MWLCFGPQTFFPIILKEKNVYIYILMIFLTKKEPGYLFKIHLILIGHPISDRFFETFLFISYLGYLQTEEEGNMALVDADSYYEYQ